MADIEETEVREYKTVQKYELVTILSYLIGIRNGILDNEYGDDYAELLETLRNSREARIVRYLCKVRTALFKNYKKTDEEIKYNLANINRLDWFEEDDINQLEDWGVHIILYNSSAEQYSIHINKLICAHIGACSQFFPEWVKWDYVKDLFVIPDYEKPKVLKAEYMTYKENRKDYPYSMYLHWKPDGRGNLLNSDGRVLKTIYKQHHDYFFDGSKYHDAVEGTKENIYEFIQDSSRVVIVVDCENSDVYKLYGVLKNLNQDQLSKIEKIILYDDYHTSCGWDWLEKFIYIPVQHEEVERVTNWKSLVDIKMTAGVCEAYYKDHIDSFILCSSDSDFWGLISSINEARFLVMYEYSKCGQAIKDALTEKNIYHCSMDDFYTGNAGDLKKKVLLSELKKLTSDILGKSGWELTKQLYEKTKIYATEREMQEFYKKYVKTLRLKINADGVFNIEVNEY